MSRGANRRAYRRCCDRPRGGARRAARGRRRAAAGDETDRLLLCFERGKTVRLDGDDRARRARGTEEDERDGGEGDGDGDDARAARPGCDARNGGDERGRGALYGNALEARGDV